ncbi:MAG TPA: plastocyanin/azurin family copper-binding protein [Gemmatimonadales bacterium]|jgi:plastocyanin|nr:plastocyanin/azurin family copper-binding protein [Gemmatimonadales bacterium]
MRLTALAALVALGAAACGGGDKNANAAPAAATPAAATPATTPSAAPAGPVVEVKMTGNGTSQAAFEPKTLTIAPGTTVRFVNVVGGPHNVSFFKDSIPAGAEAVLNAAMANRIDNLEGALLVNANDHYDVSFAGAPEGVYKGFCLPHQALGMRIAITVKK